jgi:transcriptional regulator with XRE-family HTH domain
MLVNLKAALAARRVRQVDLAILLGISPSVFSEIINGRRIADSSLRARIAKELDADESWLFVCHASIPAPRSFGIEATPALACAGE